MPTVPNILPPSDVANIIFEPTTITQPGFYLVTQDISAPSNFIIKIQAHNVTIDLNGFTLSVPQSPGGNNIIDVAPGFTNITIKNGTITGGTIGIRHESTGPDRIRIQIENVTVQNYGYRGIAVNYVDRIDLLDCNIISDSNSGVSVDASTGLILRNTFRCADSFVFMATNINGALIKDNQLHGESDGLGLGITGNANIIEGNAISRVHGYPISVDGNNNLILNNTVGGSFLNGINVQKNSNLISGNVVGGSTSGVAVAGSYNMIEGNTLGSNNEFGIDFVSGTDNAYRNNMLRGNGLAPVQDTNGNGNTDAGGNII